MSSGAIAKPIQSGVAPSNPAVAPGGKGHPPQGQPMPGAKGQPQPGMMPQPMLGGNGVAQIPQGQPQQPFNIATSLQGQPQMPGGKGGASAPGGKGQPPQGQVPGGKGQPPQGQTPGGKGAGQPQMPGGKGVGQPMPGGKGLPIGQPDLLGLNTGYPMPGGNGVAQIPQGQPQQPFNIATSNDYNVQNAARSHTPYAPPGTNGGPAAFGMSPGNAGFGFGNGATRVPDTAHLTAGQFNPNVNPMQQRQPQPTAQPMTGLPMYNS